VALPVREKLSRLLTMFVARSAWVRTFCSNACFGSFSLSMFSSICVYDETPVKGVLTS
jgi:hypothetical protein